MKDKKTIELLSLLNQIKDEHDLESFASHLSEENRISFIDYLTELTEKKGVKKSTLVSSSGLQRNYAYQILNGSKNPTRDKVLALCLALQLSLEETQRALTLADKGQLYPKSLRDAVFIFSLNTGRSVIETNELLYEMNLELMD